LQAPGEVGIFVRFGIVRREIFQFRRIQGTWTVAEIRWDGCAKLLCF